LFEERHNLKTKTRLKIAAKSFGEYQANIKILPFSETAKFRPF